MYILFEANINPQKESKKGAQFQKKASGLFLVFRQIQQHVGVFQQLLHFKTQKD